MTTLSEQIREIADAYIKTRFNLEDRKRIIARAQRKAHQTYKMSPEQSRVFTRIRRHGGALSRLEYLTEDWRVTNSMFSRGWLAWRNIGGEPCVVIGDRAPKLEIKP